MKEIERMKVRLQLLKKGVPVNSHAFENDIVADLESVLDALEPNRCERCQEEKRNVVMVPTGFSGESENLCADCISLMLGEAQDLMEKASAQLERSPCGHLKVEMVQGHCECPVGMSTPISHATFCEKAHCAGCRREADAVRKFSETADKAIRKHMNGGLADYYLEIAREAVRSAAPASQPTAERGSKCREEIQNIADVDHDNRSDHAKEGEK